MLALVAISALEGVLIAMGLVTLVFALAYLRILFGHRKLDAPTNSIAQHSFDRSYWVYEGPVCGVTCHMFLFGECSFPSSPESFVSAIR